MRRQNDWLSHHGISGQRWGVQNGPPYPLSSATHKAVLKKGKKVQSMSMDKPKDPDKGMYVSFTFGDKKFYKETMPEYYKTLGAKVSYKNIYTLTEDLVVPNEQTVKDTLEKLILNDKIDTSKMEKILEESFTETKVKQLQKKRALGLDSDAPLYNVFRDYIDRRDFKGLCHDPDFLAWYGFRYYAVANLWSERGPLENALKEQGYNGMFDYEDINFHGTKKPVIIFDASKTLGHDYISKMVK